MQGVLFIHLLLLISTAVFSQQNEVVGKEATLKKAQEAALIFSDDFSKSHHHWVAEFEEPMTSKVGISKERLDVNTSAGATIWFKEKLSGNIMITYNVFVSDSSGQYDRVSDVNAFWMATNPAGEVLLKQDGKFSSYDRLNLYYAGVGGHDNTRTRFRKYKGNKAKPVLKEYKDKGHLLVGNQDYCVKIIVNNGVVQYFLNDVLYWELKDAHPYTEGYFAFRTTRSHQLFDNFKVFRIH
jgi:hypothetical protein